MVRPHHGNKHPDTSEWGSSSAKTAAKLTVLAGQERLGPGMAPSSPKSSAQAKVTWKYILTYV
jgi:hypothetical protein